MRKIRPIALLSLFLCVVMLLVSCGGSGSGKVKALSFKDVVKKSTAEEPATAQIEKLTLEGTVTQTSYPFVVLSQTDKQIVYNIEQNKIVFTNTNAALFATTTFSFFAPDGRAAYFTVRVTDNTGMETKYQTDLYDASGNKIATVDRLVAPTRNFDLVSFDGKVYRLGDTSATATLTQLTAYSPLDGDIPNISAATADYYYAFDVAPGWMPAANNVHIYDKDLKLVSVYNVEGAPANVTSLILDNGNVVFQAIYQMPDDTEDYTYFDGTNKMKMKTVIVNAKNGKETEVSFGYSLVYGASMSVDNGRGVEEDDGSISNKIRTVAGVFPIRDRILMNGATDAMLVVLDTNMKILGRMDAMYDNQMPLDTLDDIYPSYYTVNLANGKTLLIDKDGKEIGNIGGATEVTYSYIYAGGKLYDYSLAAVYDYKAAGYDLEEALEHSAILSKDNDGTKEYFIYTNGALTALDTKTDKLTFLAADADIGIYIIQDTTDLLNVVTKYYNDKGELGLSLNKGATLTPVAIGDEFGLLRTIDPETSQPVYYRVAF